MDDVLNDQGWICDSNISYSDYYEQKNAQQDQFVEKLALLLESFQQQKKDI